MSHRPSKANRQKKVWEFLFCRLVDRMATSRLWCPWYFDDILLISRSVIIHLDDVLGQPWSSRCQQETSLCRRSRWPHQYLVDETEWSHPISDLWSVMMKTLFRRKSTWDLSQIWIKMGPLRYNIMIIITDLKKSTIWIVKSDYPKIDKTSIFEMWQGDA